MRRLAHRPACLLPNLLLPKRWLTQATLTPSSSSVQAPPQDNQVPTAAQQQGESGLIGYAVLRLMHKSICTLQASPASLPEFKHTLVTLPAIAGFCRLAHCQQSALVSTTCSSPPSSPRPSRSSTAHSTPRSRVAAACSSKSKARMGWALRHSSSARGAARGSS